jgi:isoamylase
MSQISNVPSGRPYPLGAIVDAHGVNFSFFSYHASAVELLLFDYPDQSQASTVFKLDPAVNRTGSYWHIYIPGLQAGQLYGYRVHGLYEPQQGLRFDPAKLLMDPYARAVFDDQYDRVEAARYGVENMATAMKSVVVDTAGYDWQGDQPLRDFPLNATIYELHVRGFTKDSSSGLAENKRGTYAGLVEKIPYLQELGVQIVELMPVFQFDRQSAPDGRPNYWGYEPVSFFAPHRAYSLNQDPLGPVDEFRDMVKALHRAGIAVILDMVFNHTAEDNENGPTLSLRGIDNSIYYLLNRQNQAEYINDSGVGNTLNSNHTIVRRMILDSLRYWVQQMHVDGFRFDLASVLTRDKDNQPSKDPPVLWDIDSDPVLSGTRIIAEAWDAAGLYQVGSFVGDRWSVWNGRYRDTVRRFVKSDIGTVGDLANAISGSMRLFPQLPKDPMRSINFVTAHDGFTLNDLVSYNGKHNEANGEDNRDGNSQNNSWNCGAEGPTNDTQVELLRRRQLRNFFTILFLSEGQPMFLMGDEVRRTQQGNNNAYCQDNEISWFDWDLVNSNQDLLRFVKELLKFRQKSALFRDRRYWLDSSDVQIQWHGIQLGKPDLSEQSHSLAYELEDSASQEHLHVLLNAYWEPLNFELPPLPAYQRWARLVDTANQPPGDFADPAVVLPESMQSYQAQARSAVVLIAQQPVPQE